MCGRAFGIIAGVLIIAWAGRALAQCNGDFNTDGMVTVDELVLAVDHALHGCQVVTPSPTSNDLLAELMENRAAWSRVRAVRYRMLARIHRFGSWDQPRLVALEVRDGGIVSIRDVWTGAEVTNPPDQLYRTVDGIFSLIEDAINNGADGIRVKYDPDVGAPLDTFIDHNSARFDDEVGFRISDMTIWIE